MTLPTLMPIEHPEAAACPRPLPAWASAFPDGHCGPNLEYDNAYLELVRAAQGKPETQFEPAQTPDWRMVERAALALLDRSRDLRLVILLTEARLNLHGLSALPEGLWALEHLLGSAWLHVNPPIDGADPYARINAIESLGAGGSFFDSLRQSTVVQSPRLGHFSLLDLQAFAGNTDLPQSPVLREQFEQFLRSADCDLPALRRLSEQCSLALQALLNRLRQQLSEGDCPSLHELAALFKNLQQCLPAQLTPEPTHSPARLDAPEGARPLLTVSSREQAVQAIDRVCAYLDNAEPGNPAQFLLRRARQLIDKNFLELVQELAPDALRDVARIMGIDPEQVNRSE